MAAFRDGPVLLGTALLAYTFGLRHAVDADHIAAIDNVTRKLVQEGKRTKSRCTDNKRCCGAGTLRSGWGNLKV